MDKGQMMQQRHQPGCPHSHDLHPELQFPNSINDKGEGRQWAELLLCRNRHVSSPASYVPLS